LTVQNITGARQRDCPAAQKEIARAEKQAGHEAQRATGGRDGIGMNFHPDKQIEQRPDEFPIDTARPLIKEKEFGQTQGSDHLMDYLPAATSGDESLGYFERLIIRKLAGRMFHKER